MYSDNINTMLVGVTILFILLFFASIIVAVFAKYIVSKTKTFYLWMKRHLPEIMFSGEEIYKELGKEISESRKYSLSVWVIRVLASIIALATAFTLWWILLY